MVGGSSNCWSNLSCCSWCCRFCLTLRRPMVSARLQSPWQSRSLLRAQLRILHAFDFCMCACSFPYQSYDWSLFACRSPPIPSPASSASETPAGTASPAPPVSGKNLLAAFGKASGWELWLLEHGAAWRRQWLIALTLLHAKSSGLWRFGAMETHAVASIEMHSGRADLEQWLFFLHMLVSWLCFPLTAHAWSIACMHGKHIDGSTCAHEWTTSWHAYHSKLLNFHRKQAMLHLNIMPMRFNVPTSACSSLKPVLTFAPMEKGLQPLFCPQWAEKYQPEKRQKIGIQCPAWIQDQAWLWMLECTTSPLCFVIYQAAENDMEVVNTVSDGDCLLDAFITSSFSNKKIASGALWTCFWLACCSFSLFCKSACSRPRSLRRAPWTTIRQSKTKEEKIRACRKVGVDWVDPWLHTLFEYYFHDQTLTG